MINRKNKFLVDLYLTDRNDEVIANEISFETLELERIHLLLLLKYADQTEFRDFPKQFSGRSFKAYLNSPGTRRDDKKQPLSIVYRRKVVSTAKRFFSWLQDRPGFHKIITIRWVNTFNSANRKKDETEDEENDEVSYFPFEEVLLIAKTPTETLKEERIKTAIIFLFLSGMRISAFLTLPAKAVNLCLRTVKQYPKWGVHTKLGKSRQTKLLENKDLIAIITAWDKKIQAINDPNVAWFAPISSKTGLLDPTVFIGKYRDGGFRDDLEFFMKKAGLPYRNPHQLRHGHIRYARDLAKNNIRTIEAIAFNTIQTPGTMLKYGKLSSKDAFNELDKLFSDPSEQVDNLSISDNDNNSRKLSEMLYQQGKTIIQQNELLLAKFTEKENGNVYK